MSVPLRIATRGSPLAMTQARWVARQLQQIDSSVQVELVTVQTQGDIDRSAPVTGKGVFIDALRDAVAEGRADLAVHSMKDVPVAVPDTLTLSTFGPRADARDAFVVPETSSTRTLIDLPPGGVIGTSSIRRGALLRSLLREIEIKPLRGNVDTRLRRLDEGQCDALLLACAGLDRLGLGHRIAQRIDPDVLVPAPSQGALGVEFVARRQALGDLIRQGVQADVERCVAAERELTRRLGADCAMPLGAHCVSDGAALRMTAVAADAEGARTLRVELADHDPLVLGGEVADRLDALGARALLAS